MCHKIESVVLLFYKLKSLDISMFVKVLNDLFGMFYLLQLCSENFNYHFQVNNVFRKVIRAFFYKHQQLFLFSFSREKSKTFILSQFISLFNLTSSSLFFEKHVQTASSPSTIYYSFLCKHLFFRSFISLFNITS